MPMREYRCTVCQKITEKIEQRSKQYSDTNCEYCGALAIKIISVPASRLDKTIKGY